MNPNTPTYVRLRSVFSTELQRGFEDRLIDMQQVVQIERYPDLPSIALVLTYDGRAQITAHNFDELVKAFNPISVNQGGDRLEEKLLRGASRNAERQKKAAEQKADLNQAAKEKQIDLDNEGEVISLSETRTRLEAEVEATIGGDSDADESFEDAVIGDESTGEPLV